MKSLVIIGLFIAGIASAADITISTKGEQLAFEPAIFQVKAGEKVNLTFKNVSKSMQHNFVLGKIGTGDKIVADSIAAGAPNWTSAGAEVLAKTPMIDPTKSDKITFTAPKDKGDYPFMCTFPGHGTVMKGIMKVQ